MRLKPIHKNTICQLCGSTDTYIKPDGYPEWRRYKDKYGNWTLKKGKWKIGSYEKKEFDNILLLCMDSSEPWEYVERVYIIPWADAIKSMAIVRDPDPSRGVWYYGFRIDETKFNDNYHNLMSYLGDRKYFGVEDIKRWLSL